MPRTASIHISSELFAPAESSSYEGTYAIERLIAGPDAYEFAEPLEWQVDVTNVGDALLIAGTVTGQAETPCGRCLKPVEVEFAGEIEGYFLLSEASVAPEDMEDDEFSVLPKDNIIDLAPLIQAAILLELPFTPLCKEACAGLCSRCGHDLNEGPCSCVSEDGAEAVSGNPFAVLKKISFDE